ncbi:MULTISPECIES: pyrroloquinoline quinone biosynthesis peptide chaperone PqqD [Rhodomicrobium]|uniref:pyrroloquinoline quinone biosynthesis peptide chaperone PqqD n=1 Tax=Rhodomicrobium TaxID=1068 RepID=UPI000B4BF94F|nr:MULTISPECIES: pyrroloquinoline quinone biosynthesis peptide chaperone PqqD [Rhodomicrobium]
MAETAQYTPRTRLIITEATRPALRRFVRLHHDAGRGRTVLLAPERIVEPDEIAVDVLKLCDGSISLGAIAVELAKTYDAPELDIRADITDLLQDLADKGYIKDHSIGDDR